MSTQNAPQFTWVPDSAKKTLIFQGTHITLESICKCLGALEDDAVNLLHTLLEGFQPDLDFSALHDDIGKKDPGYCLLSEERNQAVFPPCNTWLVQYILSTPELRQKFIYEELSDSERVHWKPTALRTWLKAYGRLDLLLLLQCMMSCGAPG